MPLAPQQLNIFNNQTLAQVGINNLLSPQFTGNYKEGVSYTKRTPNCQKCGQHGRKSRLKGHKRVCPYKDCECVKCQIVTERQKLMADQIKIRRRQRKDTIMNLTRDNFKTLSAATVAAVSNPQPYMSNLNNLNILCKQIAAQQTGDFQQDLENQQPLQFCGQSTMNPQASFQLSQLTKLTPSSALLPKVESPQLINSPLSTIGTEMSLSPRANSFDLGLLNGGGVSQRQLLSAVLSNNTQSDLKQAVPSSSSGLDLTPPHSAGLIAPIPVNPTQNQLNYDNLMLLSQLLAQQRPVVSMTTTPSLLQLVNPQQPSLNFQDILSLVSLFQQSQNQQISPPPEEKSPHKPNSGGFIDVCSV